MTQIKLKSLLREADEKPISKPSKDQQSKPNPFAKSAENPANSKPEPVAKPKPEEKPEPESADNDVQSKADLGLKFKQVRIYLIKAMKAASEYYNAHNSDPDSAEGTEADTLTDLLEKIYAAFSTGNPKDRSLNDEIFK